MVNVTIDEESKEKKEKRPKPDAYARLDLPVESGVKVFGMGRVKAGDEVEIVIRGRMEEKTETKRDTKKDEDYYPLSGIEARVEVDRISVGRPESKVSLDEALKASAEQM